MCACVSVSFNCNSCFVDCRRNKFRRLLKENSNVKQLMLLIYDQFIRRYYFILIKVWWICSAWNQRNSCQNWNKLKVIHIYISSWSLPSTVPFICGNTQICVCLFVMNYITREHSSAQQKLRTTSHACWCSNTDIQYCYTDNKTFRFLQTGVDRFLHGASF